MRRQKTKNVRELIKILGWGIGLWAGISFLGVMFAGFVSIGGPEAWTRSLLYSLLLSLVMAPAFLMMYSLPGLEEKEFVETDYETDSKGLGIPDDISSSGKAPEEHEHLGRVWQDT